MLCNKNNKARRTKRQFSADNVSRMQRRGNKRQLVVQICNLPKNLFFEAQQGKGANVHVLEVTEIVSKDTIWT